jgi:chemotaxis protein CheZ
MTTLHTGSTAPLHQRLAEARDETRQPIDREEIAGIVTAVLTSMEGDVSSSDLKLYGELESLARYIQHAKREIAAIRPDDINSEHIASATDELDAVVGATEDATNQIMDSCDVISAIAAKVDPEPRAELTQAVTRIFEACNFQDITGQRIGKVVGAMRFVEERVHHMIEIWGGLESFKDVETLDDARRKGDEALLNGPALASDKGVTSQDDIDALFD